MTLPALVLSGMVLASSAPGAQTPAAAGYERFVERMTYYIRDGGRWLSPNGDYKPGSGQPRSYGYEWRWELQRRVARLTIFGLFDDGRRADYWDTTVAWHPVEPHAEMFQVGAGGAIARGTVTWPGDTATDIRLTFVMPGGETWSFHETDTQLDADRFESISRRLNDGRWEVQRQAIWTRQPAGGR